MEKLGLNEIRRRFLAFFESKGHLILPSYSLIPEKDKSLLLINSGMAPLKPYFTGKEKPPKNRIATCQKCVRTPDIERVGKTARHGTFFEMLGNFSFGDYFKQEAIAWAWEFVVQELKLPVDSLWVTIYQEDDQAYELWTCIIGVPGDRIVRMGKDDNFWEIGVGPCGPCSEIYFDRGEDKGCLKPDCKIGCDCDRFVEFWNLVFTQFNRDEQGDYHPLPSPNIDTGMGLERIAAIMQGVNSLFEVDTVKNITEEISRLSGTEYGKNDKSDISIRVIADHARGMVFMISDGILPSNEGRGYVLRRILRRAAHHGKKLGIDRPFLAEVSKAVVRESSEAYPELKKKEDYILKAIETEEQRFKETIVQGLGILRSYVDDMKANKSSMLNGEKAFRLYDTYGFPLDLTKEILEEQGMAVDEQAFLTEMQNQRERGRLAQQQTDYLGSDDQSYQLFDKSILTCFKGYNSLELKAEVQAIMKAEAQIELAEQGDEVIIVLDQTPFYAESGGQMGDRGMLTGENLLVCIEDVQKAFGNQTIHRGKVLQGSIRKGDVITAGVDKEARMATARNHTVTHLLHKALKKILGDHAEQAGSMVSADRLRFDFRHFTAMSREETAEVEILVNEKIMEAISVESTEMTIDDARRLGAVALFGEKYGETVRVVKVGDYSMELCGGTHLSNTGQAGLFRILTETGVAAGVRRIEAITGWSTYDHMLAKDIMIATVAGILKSNPSELEKKASSIMKQAKEHEKEIELLQGKLAANALEQMLSAPKQIGGISYIVAHIDGCDFDALRSMVDRIRDRLGSGVVVLASSGDGKVQFVGGATKDVVQKGIHIGNLINEVAKAAGGGGGGRADMAQAGGKEPAKVQYALGKAADILARQLGLS